MTSDLASAENKFNNALWRLNNLYYIIDKRSQRIKFSLNWAQEELYRNCWYCNLILKARQLGISTFISLLFLDRCLFNSNLSTGIIAHTREDAEMLFKRVKFSYENLPNEIKQRIHPTTDSTRELVFNNGSSLRVGTSMRGSTLQYLHISEFGKICAKYPDKATEIITGSLNTIAPGQYIFIESTAEGRSGYFYDMCKKAQALQAQGLELTKLDFKFHFFPWWKEPTYQIGSSIGISQDNLDYFESLKNRGIVLEPQQKYWYAAVSANQRDNMLREFPSTPDEAWESAIDGSYYSKQMTQARLDKRICFVPYDESIPVSTAWDLGYNDSTAIWFFQLVGKEIHVIDYVEGSGESLAHWLGIVKSKPYIYEKHLAPHDIKAHEYTTGMSRIESARKMGMNFIPVPKVEVLNGIDQVRLIFNRCWFDEKKCDKGLKALEAYKKEWNEKLATWNSGPLHDFASHGADAFRTLATGLPMLQNAGKPVDARTLGSKERKSLF